MQIDAAIAAIAEIAAIAGIAGIAAIADIASIESIAAPLLALLTLLPFLVSFCRSVPPEFLWSFFILNGEQQQIKNANVTLFLDQFDPDDHILLKSHGHVTLMSPSFHWTISLPENQSFPGTA